ncbi:ATP-binding protein [Streptomyces sp. H39-S7]|uniref:ATP-binding protein n=1 Tax=Streptomyces sp. H39-S7 TaxID=3004357 RepID=UPI0022AF7D23|nr:ATP-binding protein [Streptomyces sp. H39-S7]MCZ4120996.1 ATP-binding protein [Streptomyces sp. H39-S7]
MMVEHCLAMAPTNGEVGAARDWALRHVNDFPWCADWRPDAGSVALVVSELVTNAQRHAGGSVELSLVLDVSRLRIAVSDDSRVQPVMCPAPADPGKVGGHGLRIVAELAGEWGVTPCGPGKQVWADLLPPGPLS